MKLDISSLQKAIASLDEAVTEYKKTPQNHSLPRCLAVIPAKAGIHALQ